MTYYLIAVYVFSLSAGHGRYDTPVPQNLGEFRSKEACTDAAHKVEMMIKSKGGAAFCVQTK